MSPAEPDSTPQPDLSRISPPAHVDKTPDADTQLETKSFESERRAVLVQGLRQDTEERKKYACLFFLLSCGWIFIITLILLLQGFGSFCRFRLSDPIVLATIGSTTVNVLGILYIVANYLFPKRGPTDKP